MASPRLAEIDRIQAALGDRYVVEREVARGGWAAVFRARDRKHDRVVAVKVFHPELAHTLGPERFLQEIRLVAGFQHPYILPLHDSGETAESLYYVMPFVEGETLRDRLMREGRLALEDALAIARDMLAALAYAHDRGVLHRDIKPENILLSGGHALVADFGIARAVSAARGDRGVRLSRPGIAVGTPAYMAPEQALGGEDADGRSDVYSVAAVLYEMLAGRPPYPDATLASVVDRHAEEQMPSELAALRPDLPEDIPRAVMRALALTPDERWPTATAFANALAPRITPLATTWTPTEVVGRERRVRRLRWAVVMGLVVAAAGGALALWQARHAAPVGPSSIAVFPFTVRGDAEFRFLAPGMVDLLSADLDGAGELRAVDAHAVLGAIGDDSMPLTPARARALATRLGANRFVIGSVTEEGGRLRILATLYDRGDPPHVVAQADADGESGKLFELVDELATELIARERGGPGARLTRLAARTTQSLPALKSYLRGEDQLRHGQPDSAMALFGEALALDPRFGLAAYRRALAADWAANFTEARLAGERALQLGDRLSEDDRRLLEAFLAWHKGDAARAEQLYRAILQERPDDVEAWYQLGEVLFHYGALRGEPMGLAKEPLQHAHALDPQTGHATLHLLDIAAREGDEARFDTLLASMKVDGQILLRRRAARDLALGTPEEHARTLAALAGASDGTIAVTVGGLASYRHDLASAVEVARLLTAPTRPAPTRAYGHVLLAQLAWARGRPREASRHLDLVAPLDSVAALEWRAFGTLLRWLPSSLRETEQLRARLAAWDGSVTIPAEERINPIMVHDSVHASIKRYLDARLSVRLGDLLRAQELAAQLDSIGAAGAPGASTLPQDLAHAVRASIAQARGDDAAALAEWDAMRMLSPLERIANSPFYAFTVERWSRGEVLRATGRTQEASRWYESLGDWRPDIPFVIVAQLRAGQLREAAGDRAAALAAYRVVVREWRDCEPEVRTLRDEAAAGIKRIEGR